MAQFRSLDGEWYDDWVLRRSSGAGVFRMSIGRLPLFAQLARLLHPLDPAELHGLLCGLLCADPTIDRQRWLELVRIELANGVESSAEVGALLGKFLEFGSAQLSAVDGSVTPLLPDDDAPLLLRAAALGAWCQGLLYGLGLGQAEQRGVLSAESREFLRDVTEIAHVGFETDLSTEADEVAYTEVVEYLRVGLLLLLEDLRRPHPPRRLH